MVKGHSIDSNECKHIWCGYSEAFFFTGMDQRGFSAKAEVFWKDKGLKQCSHSLLERA